jgi:hypothetical protein
MEARADMGDEDLMTESGGEPETKATRLSSSVALWLDWELARAFRQALEVVMDGSVADARSSLGLLLLLLRVDESLRDMGRDSGGEAMLIMVVLVNKLRGATFDACSRKPG